MAENTNACHNMQHTLAQLIKFDNLNQALIQMIKMNSLKNGSDSEMQKITERGSHKLLLLPYLIMQKCHGKYYFKKHTQHALV